MFKLFSEIFSVIKDSVYPNSIFTKIQKGYVIKYKFRASNSKRDYLKEISHH